MLQIESTVSLGRAKYIATPDLEPANIASGI